MSRWMRSFRRLRIAHVAIAMMSTSPTSEAAVITPTESALFWRKLFGATAVSAVDDGAADVEELEELAGKTTVAVSTGVDVGAASVALDVADCAALVELAESVVEELVADVALEVAEVVSLVAVEVALVLVAEL